MALHSNQVIQVRLYPIYSIPYPCLGCHSYLCEFNTYQAQLYPIRTSIHHKLYKKYENSAIGPNLQSEIARKAKWPSACMKKNSTINLLLTWNYIVKLIIQDHDQDMADSSSPTNNKRGQLTNQQSNQQKKNKK